MSTAVGPRADLLLELRASIWTHKGRSTFLIYASGFPKIGPIFGSML